MENFYELLYIIPEKINEEEIPKVVAKINNLIQELEGKIIYAENWGKKRLVYPIKYLQYGYYILNKINLKASRVKKLEEKLKIIPEILRYQIVQIKEQVQKPVKRIKTVKTEEKIEKKEKKERTKKVTLEELDKKIEKILEV